MHPGLKNSTPKGPISSSFFLLLLFPSSSFMDSLGWEVGTRGRILTSAQRNSWGLGKMLPTEPRKFPLSLPHSYSVLLSLDGNLLVLNVALAHIESLEKT